MKQYFCKAISTTSSIQANYIYYHCIWH